MIHFNDYKIFFIIKNIKNNLVYFLKYQVLRINHKLHNLLILKVNLEQCLILKTFIKINKTK